MKILVVEPNSMVRTEICGALKNSLKPIPEVVEVKDLSVAFTEANEHLDTDVVFIAYDSMTGKGGQIAQEIKAANPALKVVVMSTDSTPDIAKHLGLDGFLYKDEFRPTTKIQTFIRNLSAARKS